MLYTKYDFHKFNNSSVQRFYPTNQNKVGVFNEQPWDSSLKN